MIKAVPDDFTYPRESTGEIEVIRLTNHVDISYIAFQLAWQRVYEQHGNLVWPKDFIMAWIPLEIVDMLKVCLRGDFLVGKNTDIDEYWITFIDMKSGEQINKIFYSAGA